MSYMMFIIKFLILLLGSFVIFMNYYYKNRHFRNYVKAIKVSRKINQFPNDSFIFVYLRKIDPFVFEELLLYSFKKKGYKVFRNKSYTGDGGLDGKVKINHQLYFIQAKRYESFINPKHLIEFNELCTKRKVKGLFIHTGKTGKESRMLVKQYPNIEIISGSNLLDLLRI